MGMSNTFATIPGFLGPEIVGVLTEKNVSHTYLDTCIIMKGSVRFMT